MDELVNWFPAERVDEMADLYREMYPVYAIAPTPALPGARRRWRPYGGGGRAIVVTAKYEPNASCTWPTSGSSRTP
ncbi:hypothetical protein GCM10023238_28940 [Streptomyces heliomycini]